MGGKPVPPPFQTCLFCEEVLNNRFSEAISEADMQVKQEALPLLEGMLKVIADERFTIKQVLGHPWLAEERAQDPDPVHTEEEALLFTIPRPQQQRRSPSGRGPNNSDNGHQPPPLQVYVRKFEYPYLRDPDCTILASCYRSTATNVKLGDVTTFGGILSRVGVPNGERMLQTMPPFGPQDYVVSLDGCIPRRARGEYFRHAYLCLLDHPNDRRSIYNLYRGLRQVPDLSDSTSAIVPLLGFDFKFAPSSEQDEEINALDAVYEAHLGDASRRKFVLQQWLSFAYHLAQTTTIEHLSLSSWKHATFSLVKSTCEGMHACMHVCMCMLSLTSVLSSIRVLFNTGTVYPCGHTSVHTYSLGRDSFPSSPGHLRRRCL